MRSLCVYLFVCLVHASVPAATGLWKWLGPDRRLHVSDLPPPASVPDADILQRPGGAKPPADAASAAEPTASAPRPDAEYEARLKKAKTRSTPASQPKTAEQLAAEEEFAARQAENCKVARSHLRALESGIRIAQMNDKGEREFMDDAAREASEKRTRRIIASDCRS
jgi:hypothetical protein